MASQAVGEHALFKVDFAIAIPGTVDPSGQIGPIGNRKLKKLVALPVKIGLTFSPGSDHYIHSLRARGGIQGRRPDGRLVKTIGLGLHAEIKVRVGSLENILAFRKGTQDGFPCRELRR